MRLHDLNIEQLRAINIAGLSQRQLDEMTVELLMRLVLKEPLFISPLSQKPSRKTLKGAMDTRLKLPSEPPPVRLD